MKEIATLQEVFADYINTKFSHILYAEPYHDYSGSAYSSNSHRGFSIDTLVVVSFINQGLLPVLWSKDIRSYMEDGIAGKNAFSIVSQGLPRKRPSLDQIASIYKATLNNMIYRSTNAEEQPVSTHNTGFASIPYFKYNAIKCDIDTAILNKTKLCVTQAYSSNYGEGPHLYYDMANTGERSLVYNDKKYWESNALKTQIEDILAKYQSARNIKEKAVLTVLDLDSPELFRQFDNLIFTQLIKIYQLETLWIVRLIWHQYTDFFQYAYHMNEFRDFRSEVLLEFKSEHRTTVSAYHYRRLYEEPTAKTFIELIQEHELIMFIKILCKLWIS
jgi:hypothetical protein